MKKLVIVSLLSLVCVLSRGQEYTNLTTNLRTIFLSMRPFIQTNTLATYADYQKACRRSPEFAGIATNNVYDDTGTNIIGTVVTTNHVRMSFSDFYIISLQQDAIGLSVEGMNANLRQEMYFKVGKTVVDGWNP